MIHPTADVKSRNIGNGTSVWQFCVVLENAVIGSNCNINCHVFIENDVTIGNHVTIKPGVQVWDGITLGDKVFIGPNVTFTNDRTPRSKQYPETFLKTFVREGASVGANATILAGVTIGRYAMIGAGAVVTRDVPPFTVWYGNPASHRGYVTREGKILSVDLADKEGNRYALKDLEPILL